MVKLQIFSISKTKEQYLLQGEADYLKRLTKNSKINIVELGTSKSASSNNNQVKEQEAQRLLSNIPEANFLIALDEKGKSFSSIDFAAFFREKMNHGISSFSFAVGGPFGWDDSVKKRANLTLSLSPFTFTSQMSRLILIEQIYRAMTILQGSPYHKS